LGTNVGGQDQRGPPADIYSPRAQGGWLRGRARAGDCGWDRLSGNRLHSDGGLGRAVLGDDPGKRARGPARSDRHCATSFERLLRSSGTCSRLHSACHCAAHSGAVNDPVLPADRSSSCCRFLASVPSGLNPAATWACRRRRSCEQSIKPGRHSRGNALDSRWDWIEPTWSITETRSARGGGVLAWVSFAGIYGTTCLRRT
jgi:hypothetical protein